MPQRFEQDDAGRDRYVEALDAAAHWDLRKKVAGFARKPAHALAFAAHDDGERAFQIETVEVLRRIARQEARHVAFYTSQARDRLAASSKAQAITRFALRRFWAPVGSSISSRDDVRHVMSALMSGTEGRKAAKKVDESISALPGLSGLTIVQNALDGLGIR